MFKMNPAAKEFIPAHMKKLQQETENVNKLSKQMDKIGLSSEKGCIEKCRDSGAKTSAGQGDTVKDHANESIDSNTTSHTGNKSSQADERVQSNSHHTNDSSKSHIEEKHQNGLQDLIDEDDRYLLNAGENICEFNGEQFIIPGDDEYEQQLHEPATIAGYDFGNDQDNEDEDVCNAFEEFLENLPDQ